MRALITGAKGQLGMAFAAEFERQGWDYAAADVDKLDVTSLADVMAALSSYKPGLVINCAAYNLVDKAEAEPDKAFAVNAEGPRNLAFAAEKMEFKLLHFGTDYVFDGAKGAPYVESDPAAPLNAYGRSKLAGEEHALGAPGALVFRLSWVFGRGEQNFIHKLWGWAAGPGPLRISADEVSVPTRASDVVDASLAALGRGLTGLWHLTNTGACSRLDWARLILKESGLEKEIVPASMADFKLPARRPAYSAMSNAALRGELDLAIPTWQEATAEFIRENK